MTMGLQTSGYRSAKRGYWEGLVAEPENPLALASKQVMKLPLSPAGTRNSAGVLLFNEAQVCSFKHVPIPVQPWWNRKKTVIGPIGTPAQMWLQGPSGCMQWSPGGRQGKQQLQKGEAKETRSDKRKRGQQFESEAGYGREGAKRRLSS